MEYSAQKLQNQLDSYQLKCVHCTQQVAPSHIILFFVCNSREAVFMMRLCARLHWP